LQANNRNTPKVLGRCCFFGSLRERNVQNKPEPVDIVLRKTPILTPIATSSETVSVMGALMIRRIVAAILIASGVAACAPYDYPYEGYGERRYYGERHRHYGERRYYGEGERYYTPPRPRRVCDADGCWYPVPKRRYYTE
jgi:hypothetical protein